jgi:hypothetical protein
VFAYRPTTKPLKLSFASRASREDALETIIKELRKAK